MSFAEAVAQDRRVAILHILAEAQGFRANDSLIHIGLTEIGHGCSRDLVRTELAWLKEQGIVAVETVQTSGSAILVATLTERGADVQSGRITVPGVKRPGPKG